MSLQFRFPCVSSLFFLFSAPSRPPLPPHPRVPSSGYHVTFCSCPTDSSGEGSDSSLVARAHASVTFDSSLSSTEASLPPPCSPSSAPTIPLQRREWLLQARRAAGERRQRRRLTQEAVRRGRRKGAIRPRGQHRMGGGISRTPRSLSQAKTNSADLFPRLCRCEKFVSEPALAHPRLLRGPATSADLAVFFMQLSDSQGQVQPSRSLFELSVRWFSRRLSPHRHLVTLPLTFCSMRGDDCKWLGAGESPYEAPKQATARSHSSFLLF